MTSLSDSTNATTNGRPFTGRREDAELLRGEARFVADLAFDGLHAAFVRSPLAHARIESIDVADALAAPGVVAVYTAADLGLGPFVHFPTLDHAVAQSRHPLAADRVRHVGEAVALVLATDPALAADAVEGVVVDYERLEVIVDPDRSADGPLLYPESGTNEVLRIESDAPDPLVGAAAVVELTVENPKVSSLTMECDSIVATPTDDGLDIWCTSQGVHELRDELAISLGVEPSTLRLRSPFVGGGFGGRATLPVEFAAVAQAARLIGRPVRWIQTRSEQLTGQPHGRGLRTRIRIGADADGRLLGLDTDVTADAGATGHMAALLLVSVHRQFPGLYRWDAVRATASTWLTNTTPVGAYRGAGQPEANHARERALDVLARRLGIDPIDLRRRNLVDDGTRPQQPARVNYDEVSPRRALEVAVETADVAGWRRRQADARSADGATRIGIGVSCYAQTSGRGAPADGAELRLLADGGVEVLCGSPAHGQGHEHTFTQLVADRLGIDPDAIRYVDADTAAIGSALSTGGSRATQVLGSLLDGACDDVIERARPLVAERLEVSPADLVVAPAGYGLGPGLAVNGVPTRRVEWVDLAADSENGCLAAARNGSMAGATHPFGTHVSVVSVDVETGRIELLAHTSVDDCGVVLQPTLVAGQQQGGSVAGIAQALGEAVRHDAGGSPMTGTLGTYLLPSAAEVCPITTVALSTPTDRNALGTRGIGENGCNGATAAVHNAVIDALSEWGVEHIDLPLDPEAIWRAVARR